MLLTELKRDMIVIDAQNRTNSFNVSVDRYIKAVCPILGVNYDHIAFEFGQEHLEWMLSSRNQLMKQLALAVFKGKPVAKARTRKLLLDGFVCVPQFTLPRS